MRLTYPIVMAYLAVSLVGCGELALVQKERQMELVARDWAMTIRASQVIPIYPLNQDIQPGDVFVVNQTVAEQSRTFRERGFMPTDLRLCRLGPIDYSNDYLSRDGDPEDQGLYLPGAWRNAPAPEAAWDRFPRAGFPTYTFRVSNSGGLSAALPVQSIPVAFSLTGAARATGSVTMSDAVTYGTDASLVYGLLDEARRGGRLNGVLPVEGQPLYLRVVTRVFAAKTFDIVMTTSATMGGGVDVGTSQEVQDPAEALGSGLTVEEINSRLANVGQARDAAGNLLPGGSVRATFSSGRTIGFKESYTEPIVVGYQGFDVVLDESGRLGPIIPTFQVLEGRATPSPRTGVEDSDSAYLAMLDLLRAQPPQQVTASLRRAAANSERIAAAFERGLVDRPGDPVAVWVGATRDLQSTESGRHWLLAWVSAAIREEVDNNG